MALALSKVNARGRISIPVEVRKRLGIGSGSVLEWHEQEETIVIRRAGKYSSQDIHNAIFPEKVGRKTLADLKEGIRKYIRKRHACD